MASKALSFAKRAFPAWRGRKVRVCISDRPIPLIAIWSDGSRDTFVGMEINGRFTFPLPVSSNPFQPLKPNYAPCAGCVVVEHTIFRGKDVGCTLYVHPSDAAHFVDAPKGDPKPVA